MNLHFKTFILYHHFPFSFAPSKAMTLMCSVWIFLSYEFLKNARFSLYTMFQDTPMLLHVTTCHFICSDCCIMFH